MSTLERILVTILEDIGVEAVLRLIAARSDKEIVKAVLDAEYAAAEAAAAEAERTKFGGGGA